MIRRSSLHSFALCLLVALAVVSAPQLVRAGSFVQHNLVSDIPGLADNTDPHLVNPWGMSFSATSPFWVSDAGTGVATIYNGAGMPQALVVTIPPPPGGFSGPTGQVRNGTSGFHLANGNPAAFIFATLSGTISGWNSGTQAELKVNSSATSAYTGLAIGNNGSADFLYAANFRTGKIDVFNSTFNPATVSGGFLDATLPAGYSPFNIQNIGGKLYVEFAKVGPDGRSEAGPGNGFVDVFDTNGNLLQRLVSNGSLNAPWGVALAPAGFGDFGGDILVGNFGNGVINAFDPITGMPLGSLDDPLGQPIRNIGLWALSFGNGGPGFDPNALYFTAGIAGSGMREDHGLFGRLDPVPEPGVLTLFSTGLLGLLGYIRRRVKPSA